MGLQAVAPTPTLTVGGRVFTDLANLKILGGTTAAANGRCNFREGNATSGYQVPVGKKFVVQAIQWSSGTATLAIPSLVYSDNDVGFNSATAFTNRVNYLGSTASLFNSQTGIGEIVAQSVNFEVPAGKYVGYDDENATEFTTVQVFGYEVSV